MLSHSAILAFNARGWSGVPKLSAVGMNVGCYELLWLFIAGFVFARILANVTWCDVEMSLYV